MTASPISSFTTFGGFTGGGFVASAATENRAVIDLPVNGSRVTDGVAGWAIQENAAGGTGVDTVRVWGGRTPSRVRRHPARGCRDGRRAAGRGRHLRRAVLLAQRNAAPASPIDRWRTNDRTG
jgi:hypothetical protein